MSQTSILRWGLGILYYCCFHWETMPVKADQAIVIGKPFGLCSRDFANWGQERGQMKIDGVIGCSRCQGRTPLPIMRAACLDFPAYCRRNCLSFFGKTSSERKREIASESLQPMSWPSSPSPIMRTALTQVTTTDRGKSSPNTRQRLDTTSWLVAAKGCVTQVTLVQANNIHYAQFWTQESSTTFKSLTESGKDQWVMC